MSNFVSIGLFCHPLAAKNLNFYRYFGIWLVANLHQSEKVEHGCTTTNLHLSNGVKSFLNSNAFMPKSGAQSLTFASVTDRQTNKKTQRFGRHGGG